MAFEDDTFGLDRDQPAWCEQQGDGRHDGGKGGNGRIGSTKFNRGPSVRRHARRRIRETDYLGAHPSAPARSAPAASRSPLSRLSRRSEERRGGKECVRTCRSRGSTYNKKKKKNKTQLLN